MRPHPRPPQPPQAGYSLVELTLATSILAVGVAAAASLTITSTRIEEMNHRKSRVLALTEGAARLWQLGLNPDQSAALLLGDPALASLTFGAPTPITATRQGLPDASPGTFETITLRSSVLRQDHSGPPPSDAPVHPLRELRPIR